MLHYLQNPIIFSIALGVFVAIYSFFEDSLSDKPIINKVKYIRAFIVTAVGVNVLQTYVRGASAPLSGGMGGFNHSYSTGNAPF